MPKNPESVNPNRSYANAWIVYINGIEVPVASASVSYGVWKIPQAEIVLIPDLTIQRLGADDRLAVQIFYCDHWIRPNRPEFRLLFDGEIIGWSYVNVQRGRSLAFTAVDYFQVFTQMFFFFMSSVDDLAIGTIRDITVGPEGVNTAGFGPLFPYSLFSKGLLPAEANNTGDGLITRPIEYVYNVVQGFTQDLQRRSVPAANFFSPWAERTRFARRFVALPYLEEGDGAAGVFPILRAVQADWAVGAVAQLTANIGTAGSIYDVFVQVLSTLMMELAMLPTPPSVTVDNELNIIGMPPKKASDTVRNNLGCYFVKPQFLFGLPPTCNVFFPSQINQFGYQENYATQPTRMYFNDDSWTTYLAGQQNGPGLEETVRSALTVAHPEEVNIAMKAALSNPELNGRNVLVYPEEFFRGPVVDRRTMPRWFLFLNKAQNASSVDLDQRQLTADQILGINRNVPTGDPQRDVFRLYASYEYTKERYSRRTGGLSMAFNPYPVPGFPCAVFDRRSTQVDVFAYVMHVQHVLTVRSMQTDVSLSYGRTFQEAFALIRKQVDTENAVIEQDRADVAAKSAGEPGSVRLPPGLERVGPIAVGPAEPLSEIRDRIQSFDRAEAFYTSLFYRGKPKDSNKISEEQLRADLVRRADAEEGIIIPEAIAESQETPDIETYLSNKDAAFKYNKIIRVTNTKGTVEDVQLQGIDASTRYKMISVIEKMRVGTASDDELTFIRNATANPELQQQPAAPAIADPNLTNRLNLIEENTQNSFTYTNLHGNTSLSPKPGAANLFENFDAAMFYNARPICTLDEYITFLGADAHVEGKVTPGEALAENSERTFPAVYYERIRKYRAGPPAGLPTENITNSHVVTNADGVYVIPYGASQLDVNAASAAFAAAADAEAAAAAALAATTDPAAQSVPEAEPIEIPISPELLQSTPVNPATVPSNVTGIPADFPQTSQDWDALLLAYRKNVLHRLAPGT